jgi:hypothetical protein
MGYAHTGSIPLVLDCYKPNSILRQKRGAGYFLTGVWGYPPTLKVHQNWGIRGLIETFSAVFIVETRSGGKN